MNNLITALIILSSSLVIFIICITIYKFITYILEKRKIDKILKYIDIKSEKDKDIAKNVKLCLDIIRDNKNKVGD